MAKVIRSIFLVAATLSLVGCTTSKNSSSSSSSGSESGSIKEIWERDITKYGLLDKDSNVTIHSVNKHNDYLTKVDYGKIESIISTESEYYKYVSGVFPGKYVFNYYSSSDGYSERQIEIYITDLLDICGLPPIPFEDVTYDKDNDQYIASEVTMTLQDWTFTITNVVAKFVDNKLSQMTYDMSYGEDKDKSESCTLTFSNYGQTSVTLPN